MNVLVAVIVYDRFDNIKEWVRCWKQCDTDNATLVIVHNYENERAREAYQYFCGQSNVHYVPRHNRGFDIGAFQDVCKNRLPGFPQDFDALLWCTDDVLPMKKNFVQMFRDKFTNGVKAVAMELSKEVHPHIRTTGFMLMKEDLPNITFPADPVITKAQCYEFEHRDKQNSLIDQVKRWGKVLQVDDIEYSPLWDTGIRSKEAKARYERRQKEHLKEFKQVAHKSEHIAVNPKVIFICPIYNSYPEIITSLLNQTYKNWELYLIHDGPSKINHKAIVEAVNDPRITYVETEKREGNWGHGIRQRSLQSLKHGDFVVITNGDNHHVPTYIEFMLSGFHDGTVAVYCSQMVHSYKAWGVIDCKLEQGYLDCAGVMIKRDVACQVGWNNVDAHSADWLYFTDIAKKYGWDKFRKVEGCLLIHN